MSNGLDYRHLQRAVEGKGYAFFDKGDYNLNIVGFRTEDDRSNLFNDWICLAFRQNDIPHLFVFAATTDPGVYWRKHPMNVDGTAILKPGQYPGAFHIGKHQGKYEALVQRGPMTVYRDNDKDDQLDTGPGVQEQTGLFGINLHRASMMNAPGEIGKWSAGCQVIADGADFDLFMAIARRAARDWPAKFTYTLLDERDVWQA